MAIIGMPEKAEKPDYSDFKKRLLQLAKKLDRAAKKWDKAGDTAKASQCRDLSHYLKQTVKEWEAAC